MIHVRSGQAKETDLEVSNVFDDPGFRLGKQTIALGNVGKCPREVRVFDKVFQSLLAKIKVVVAIARDINIQSIEQTCHMLATKHGSFK